MTTDPLNDALRDATLAVLLGSTTVPSVSLGYNGEPILGTVTIQSAFVERIRALSAKGEFDDLLREAMGSITPEDVVGIIKDRIGEKFLAGLESVNGSYGNSPTPGWLQQQARTIAVQAATTALAADEALLDTLRGRIGAEVDRNRVGITVSLSDPENR